MIIEAGAALHRGIQHIPDSFYSISFLEKLRLL